jgi:WhiB family transcriptional regulator, redox-sensing transcriptional regulator
MASSAHSELATDWWPKAACQSADPELFFPVSTAGPSLDDVSRAKAVCARCEVQQECLAYALATRQVHGMWGGTSPDERQRQLELVCQTS